MGVEITLVVAINGVVQLSEMFLNGGFVSFFFFNIFIVFFNSLFLTTFVFPTINIRLFLIVTFLFLYCQIIFLISTRNFLLYRFLSLYNFLLAADCNFLRFCWSINPSLEFASPLYKRGKFHNSLHWWRMLNATEARPQLVEKFLCLKRCVICYIVHHNKYNMSLLV